MSDYTTNTSVNLLVNGQQAAETLAALRKHALDLTEQIAKAAAAGDKIQLQKLRKELKTTEHQIKEIESSTMQVENVLRRLDKASPKELQKTLATLNKQLEYMERGSAAWTSQQQKIRAVKDEIAKMNSELGRSQTWLEKINAKVSEWQAVAAGAVAACTGAFMAGRAAVKAYADIEEEVANTRKYTGMTEEDVRRLNEAFKNMNTRTPRAELNLLAQEAGRLGKNTYEDVLGYVEAADQINVALVDLGEGATQTIAKLTDIFNVKETNNMDTKESMLAVGSAVNVLSQNCTADKKYLVEFAQRMAGVGATAKMSIPEILAFAATLDANGQKCEMSASSLGKLIMMLYKEPAKMAKQVGLDVKTFTDTMNRSTTEGVEMFLGQIQKMGSKDGLAVLAPLFDQLGMDGVRMSQVLATLANKLDMVKWEQQEANKAFNEATSATHEYEIFNNTVQAGLDKAKKGFNEMAVALGKELAPVMKNFISSTSMTMRAMLQLIQFIKQHKTAIVTLTAAIVAYTVAVNLAVIKEKLHAALMAAKTVVMHAHKIAVLLASAAYAKLTGNTIRANAAMKLLGQTMKLNPWGLLAAAIVAAGTALALYIKKQHETSLADKTLNEIRTEAAKQVANETQHLNILLQAAQNENLSLDKRKEAINKLNALIPGYNAQLDETTGKYTANKDALDKYIESLTRKYELEGAKAKLAELGTKKADLALQRSDAEESVRAAQANVNAASAASGNFNYSTTGGSAPGAIVSMHASSSAELKAAKNNLEGINKELKEIEKTEQTIFSIYGKEMEEQEVAAPNLITNEESDVTPIAADSKPDKNKFKAEDDWKEKEEALNRIAYAKGEEDYEAYTQRMLQIQVDYNQKKLAHTDLVGNEQVTIEAAYYEALKKQHENAVEGTVEQENEANDDILAILKQRYADGEMSARQYQTAIEQQELEHLRRVASLYDEGSKERIKAEKAYHDTSLKYQQKHLQEAKQVQEKFREQYFTKGFTITDKESYARDMENLNLVYKQMLQAAGNSSRDRLKVERAYQQAKYQLAHKYNIKASDDAERAQRSFVEKWKDGIAESVEWLESDEGKAMTESFSTIVSGMSSIFSGLSDIIQAELDIQTAAIESKYEAATSAAEGNKYKEVQLEKQKEKEVAKAKQDANRKMFAMQVIQAVAQTAMSAISAYSSAAAIPIVGFVMAPIAAAMAIAAGAIQIASIKKQQEASEATGYAEGGFTKPGGKYEEAGVVHAGEWVASQELLQNPTARAMINTLDYAQRTNTIGSLSADDVSQSITAPQVIAKASTDGQVQQSMVATAASLREYSSVMRDLSARLNEPFVTVNTVSGDTGIKKAQDEYNQLIKNKTPKSQR